MYIQSANGEIFFIIQYNNYLNIPQQIAIKFDVFRALVMKIQLFLGSDTLWRRKKLLMLQKNLLALSSGSVKSKKNVFELYTPSR